MKEIITVDQGRAARAILRWSLEDVAAKAGIGSNTVFRFERGDLVNANTLGHIRRAYEAAGIQFTDEGGIIPPSNKRVSTEGETLK